MIVKMIYVLGQGHAHAHTFVRTCPRREDQSKFSSHLFTKVTRFLPDVQGTGLWKSLCYLVAYGFHAS